MSSNVRWNTGKTPTISDIYSFIDSHSYSSDSLTLTFTTNGQSSSSQHFYVSGLEMIATTTQSPLNIQMNIDNFSDIDDTMDKNIRIGNPSIEFDTGPQLCVLSDGTVTLDAILFKESGAGTAISNKEIRIIIPSTAPFTWSSPGTAALTNSSPTGTVGSVSIKSGTGSKELEVNVTSDFGPSDVLSIQNTQITMAGETNDILLKAQVTTDSNDDASMPATHYIRIE